MNLNIPVSTVILRFAQNLARPAEILRFAQNDSPKRILVGNVHQA